MDNFFNNLLIWGAKRGVKHQNEENFEFYSYKGFKLITKVCDILDKNNYDEILISGNNQNNLDIFLYSSNKIS